jgi:hypothetical protein
MLAHHGPATGTLLLRRRTVCHHAPFRADVNLGGGRRLQLRWEIFNLLNRVNFDVPNRIAFTPNFGRIFSAKPARQMQFGVKFLF